VPTMLKKTSFVCFKDLASGRAFYRNRSFHPFYAHARKKRDMVSSIAKDLRKHPTPFGE
jgi:hypothetical protein